MNELALGTRERVSYEAMLTFQREHRRPATIKELAAAIDRQFSTAYWAITQLRLKGCVQVLLRTRPGPWSHRCYVATPPRSEWPLGSDKIHVNFALGIFEWEVT